MTVQEILILLAVPSVLFAIYTFIATHLIKKWETKKKENDDVRLGVQALLRNQQISEHRYFQKKGYATVEEKSNYDNMYQRYHNLGKNGVMDALHEEVMNMPTTPNVNLIDTRVSTSKIEDVEVIE